MYKLVAHINVRMVIVIITIKRMLPSSCCPYCLFILNLLSGDCISQKGLRINCGPLDGPRARERSEPRRERDVAAYFVVRLVHRRDVESGDVGRDGLGAV